MCDGHVISLKHHTLVALNGKRIITSGHEFVIQHILMIIRFAGSNQSTMSCCYSQREQLSEKEVWLLNLENTLGWSRLAH